MNMKSEKEKLIDWIRTVDDETIIEKLKLVKDSNAENGWWEELSDAEIASIERGLADAKAGRIIPHEEVKKRYEKWL
jgi:hypothetical protein